MTAPRAALLAVAALFVVLSASIAASTPAWEANDEPDHVRNVEQIAGGHWYRIEPGAGFESHQAPLYYMLLAAWQKSVRMNAELPHPQLKDPGSGTAHGIFNHTLPNEGADQRRVAFLRIPSIILGLLTILITAAAARRLTKDVWTPVVAAAVVAFVPKFVFLSSVVNNDSLSNALGALATLLAVIAVVAKPETLRGRLWLAAAMGAVIGLLILAKMTAGTIGIGLIVALLITRPSRREAAMLVGVLLAATLAVSGWWFIRNWAWYGDPLAAKATTDHLRDLFPPLFAVPPLFEQAFENLPKGIYKSFWYTSGWNQYYWTRGLLYAPFWILAAIGVIGSALPSAARFVTRPPSGAQPLIVLGVIALSAISVIWVLGLQTTQDQARVAFMGLPAIACLVAIGYERLRMPVPARFVLPAIGLLGTIVALQRDVIGIAF